MPPTALTATASGSHTRVQMKRGAQALVPHGTVQSFDPNTGVFTAFMDFQAAGDPPYTFTPVEKSDYTDQNGLVWQLVG